MKNKLEELRQELTDFIDKHDWNSGEKMSAYYTGFHMINVFKDSYIEEENTFKFEIGNVVKIVDADNTFTHYKFMADRMKLDDWKPVSYVKDLQDLSGTILAHELHPDRDDKLYGVYLPKLKQSIIINETGVELCL